MTRINEPVTGREIEMADNTVLASKTDLGGKITFANQAFVDISGFTLRELMGSPHNLVRHPHMPKEAFADLWRTIKQGRPWEGLVKNRAKNGDHYWVRANVTPVIEDGKHVGFISIRSKPTRAEIDAAERLYAKIRAGELRGYKIEEGRLVRTGFAGRIERFTRGLRNQAVMLIAVMILFSIAAAALDLGGAPISTTIILGIGAIVGGLLGWRFVYTLLSAVRRLEGYFEAMIKGDFAFELRDQTTPEFRKATDLLREMRAKLGYNLIEKEEVARRANETLVAEMQAMAEALDDEARDTVGQVAAQAKRMTEAAVQLAAISDRLRTKAREVADSVETTSGNVQTVAGATEQLEASSREITTQIGTALRLAEAARGKADVASRRVAGLTEATARIGNVVTLIQDIAGQTRLLALNATIEAERAGNAGKGFAVVASEVKELAQQTDSGIDTVSGQAEAIGKTTRETAETVQEVASTIRDIDATSAEVARAADEQRNATSEIMKSAATAAEHTRFVADTVRDMLQQAEATGETATRVDRLAAQVGQNISTLQRRLYVILHTSRGGDRRAELRNAVAVRFRAEFGNVACEGYTGDISAGGALLVAARPVKTVATEGYIDLDGIGRVGASVVAPLETGLRVKFAPLAPERAEALAACVDSLSKTDKPFLDLVEEVANEAGAALNKAIEERTISSDDLFDLHHEPIAGTDPEQMMAKHTALVEKLFPPLIEPPLARDPRIVMCCIADRSGYIAAHNQKYSHRQRPGDREWNMANARNRRVFDDSAGILAARCTRPQIQIYARQMGKGNTVLLREFDAPIKIGGRRWGAVRLALKLT